VRRAVRDEARAAGGTMVAGGAQPFIHAQRTAERSPPPAVRPTLPPRQRM